MKKLVLFIYLIIVAMSIYAQDYLVTFYGQGLSTTVDSVEIENVSQNKSITVMGDNTLRLVGVLNSNDLTTISDKLNLYPNPSSGDINLTFVSDYSENANIVVCDITGKLVFKTDLEIDKGQNLIKLSGFNAGIYIINISGNNTNYTEKFISNGTGGNNIKVETLQNSIDLASSKSTDSKSTIQWQYDEEDILIFKAFADGHSRISVYYINADTNLPFDFVLCQDANAYKYTVTTIGSVTWMAENLHTTRYNDNILIPEIVDQTEWANDTDGALCYYDADSASYSSSFGALYNFAAVNTGKLCPNGWHVPTETEFQDLLIYLEQSGYNYNGYTDSDNDFETNNFTAKSMSSNSTWYNSSVDGTPGNSDYSDYRNRTGFSAKSAGMRNHALEAPSNMQITTSFWSSTSFNETTAVRMAINYDDVDTKNITGDKRFGISVRCVKD